MQSLNGDECTSWAKSDMNLLFEEIEALLRSPMTPDSIMLFVKFDIAVAASEYGVPSSTKHDTLGLQNLPGKGMCSSERVSISNVSASCSLLLGVMLLLPLVPPLFDAPERIAAAPIEPRISAAFN